MGSVDVLEKAKLEKPMHISHLSGGYWAEAGVGGGVAAIGIAA